MAFSIFSIITDNSACHSCQIFRISYGKPIFNDPIQQILLLILIIDHQYGPGVPFSYSPIMYGLLDIVRKLKKAKGVRYR